MDEGIAVLRFDTGSGVGELRARLFPIGDGRWHRLELSQQGSSFTLRVDGGIAYSSSFGSVFQLQNLLYLGGVPQSLPMVAGLNSCIAEITINGVELDLISDAMEGAGIAECPLDLCTPETCINNGVCQENPMSLGYMCLCPLGFTGSNCQLGKGTLHYIIELFTALSVASHRCRH